LDLIFLLLSSGGHLVYLVFGQIALGYSLRNALAQTPRLVITGIQLAFNNANAAVEALKGKESEFVRTPKSGELLESDSHLSHLKSLSNDTTLSLYKAVPPKGALLELALTIVYIVVFFWAIHQQIWFLLPFILLLICGAATATQNSFVGYMKLSKQQ
jgi:hypothetical protein